MYVHQAVSFDFAALSYVGLEVRLLIGCGNHSDGGRILVSSNPTGPSGLMVESEWSVLNRTRNRAPDQYAELKINLVADSQPKVGAVGDQIFVSSVHSVGYWVRIVVIGESRIKLKEESWRRFEVCSRWCHNKQIKNAKLGRRHENVRALNRPG